MASTRSTRSTTTLPPPEPKPLKCKNFHGKPAICNILNKKGICEYAFKNNQCSKKTDFPNFEFSYKELSDAISNYVKFEDEKDEKEPEQQIDYTNHEELEKFAEIKIIIKIEDLISKIKNTISKDNIEELKKPKNTIEETEIFDQKLSKCKDVVPDLKDRFNLEKTIKDIEGIDLEKTQLIQSINEINIKYSNSGSVTSCLTNVCTFVTSCFTSCFTPTTEESELDILHTILEDMDKLNKLYKALNENIEQKRIKIETIKKLKETIQNKKQSYSSTPDPKFLFGLNAFILKYNSDFYNITNYQKRLEEYNRLPVKERPEKGPPKTKREALIDILRSLKFKEFTYTDERFLHLNRTVNIFFKEYQFTDEVFPVKIGIDINHFFWTIERWGGWRKFDPKKYIIEIIPGEEEFYFPDENDKLIKLLKEKSEAEKFINNFNQVERQITIRDETIKFYYAIADKTFFTSNQTSNNQCYPVFQYDMSQNENVFNKAAALRDAAKREIKRIFTTLKDSYGCILSNQHIGFNPVFDPQVLIDIESDTLEWLIPFINEFNCTAINIHNYPFKYKTVLGFETSQLDL
jgi:hypothetical protein